MLLRAFVYEIRQKIAIISMRGDEAKELDLDLYVLAKSAAGHSVVI
jgi:hypothetical protein